MPRSTKLPWASWSSCCRSARGTRSCSKVSQVLPEGSLDSRRSRLMRRWRRSSASCSSTSRKVARASPCPAAVKRATDWAPMVGSLNWPHNWPMRSCITLVSRHAHTPAADQADREQAVVDFQVRLPRQSQHRGFGHLGLSQVPHLRVVEGLSPASSSNDSALSTVASMVLAARCRIRTYSTSARSPRHCRSAS